MGDVLGNIGGRLQEADLASNALVWLLRVDLGGQAFLFSTEPATITDEDGVDHVYLGGLDAPSIDSEFTIASESSGVPSVGLSMSFPVSVATLAANGVHLSAATAELAIWPKTATLDKRIVLLRGRLASATYGDDGEPTTATLESNTLEDERLFPDANAVVNAETWHAAPSQSWGKVYPFVWGTPGLLPNEISTGTAGGILEDRHTAATPAIKVSDTQLLIAGHAVLADKVSLWQNTGDVWVFGSADVTTATDGIGRTCSVLVAPGSSTWSDKEWWISWFNSTATTTGGIESSKQDRVDKPLADLGELMRFLFRASSVDFDDGRVAAMSNRLAAMQTSGYIAERVKPYEWILENIVAIAPISMATSGAEGVYPIFWEMDATTDDAVAQLVESSGGDNGNCTRVSQVSYKDIGIANEISVRWGWNAVRDDFAGVTTLDGSPEVPPPEVPLPGWKVLVFNEDRDDYAGFQNAEATGWPNSYARFSNNRHGKRAMEIEAPYIYDGPTADYIAQWLSRIHATPPRVVKYSVDTKMAWLAPGDVVELTDTGAQIDGVAYVRSISWSDTSPILSLVLIEDPLRDSNTATA